MSTNFPGSIDNGTSLPYPSATNPRNNPSLAGNTDNQNDALIAIETKLGTGASTPSGTNLLVSTGTGISSWSKVAPTGTIVGTSDSQTLTNKTLTSPTISSPTITNAIISSDLITGFTTSNSGSIYEITVSSGVITAANSIGSGTIVQNGVAASELATNAITLGYVQITSSITTTSTSMVQATGLTLTVTNPSGGRRLKVTFYSQQVTNSSASNVINITLWNGTVGSGTQLQVANAQDYGAQNGGPICMLFSNIPAAGSITYNIGWSVNAGTGTIAAGTTSPAFILVEAI